MFLFDILKTLPELRKLKLYRCLIDEDVFQLLCDPEICPKLATLDFGVSRFSVPPGSSTIYEDISNVVVCKAPHKPFSEGKGNMKGETGSYLQHMNFHSCNGIPKDTLDKLMNLRQKFDISIETGD